MACHRHSTQRQTGSASERVAERLSPRFEINGDFVYLLPGFQTQIVLSAQLDSVVFRFGGFEDTIRSGGMPFDAIRFPHRAEGSDRPSRDVVFRFPSVASGFV